MDADVEKITIGVDSRRDAPFLPVEFFRDLLFPLLYEPSAEDQAAGSDDE
jgi:hypothetical protein